MRLKTTLGSLQGDVLRAGPMSNFLTLVTPDSAPSGKKLHDFVWGYILSRWYNVYLVARLPYVLSFAPVPVYHPSPGV